MNFLDSYFGGEGATRVAPPSRLASDRKRRRGGLAHLCDAGIAREGEEEGQDEAENGTEPELRGNSRPKPSRW